MRQWLAISLLLLVLAPDALAQRRLEVKAGNEDGYARLILQWADVSGQAPAIKTAERGGIVVIRFDEPIIAELENLPKILPEWISFASLADDPREIRIVLRQPEATKIHVSVSPPLTALDLALANRGVPPPIVSPQQRRKQEEDAARAASIASATPKTVDKADLAISITDVDDRSLLVFNWDRQPEYQAIQQKDGSLTLQFNLRSKPDLARLKTENPRGLASFTAFNTADGFRINLVPEQNFALTSYEEQGGILIIAITPPAEEPKEKKIAVAPPVEADNGTWLRGNWPDPVPGSGVVKIRSVAIDRGLELVVSWNRPVPAAIFPRYPSIWAVFGAQAEFEIDNSNIPAGFAVFAEPTSKASLLRISAPKTMQVKAESSGSDWIITVRSVLAGSGSNIKLQRNVSDTGRSSLKARLPGAAGIVWFEDSMIGDQVAAVVAFGPPRGVVTWRRFQEAEFLPTAHGIAIVPLSDEVVVRLAGETVSIESESGLAVTDIGFRPGPGTGYGPGLLELDDQRQDSGDEFFAHRYKLERRIGYTTIGSSAASDAYLELARFYLGHDMGHEALSVLQATFKERSLIGQDGSFLALYGIAAIMSERYKLAETWLSKSILRGDKSTTLWRALAAARMDMWDKSYEMFRIAEELIPFYPPRWIAAFHAAAASAAFHVGDDDMAGRHGRQALLSGFDAEAEQASLVMARLKLKAGETDQAYQLLSKVSTMAADPVAVYASLDMLELGGRMGKLSITEVTGALESLRYRWRGDELELQVIGALAEQYMQLGKFREALVMLRSSALWDADAPGSRELRKQLSRHFRELFLDGKVSRLDPIEALALFYEFKESVPINADGDRMIRKLVNRLVAFDLLEKAAELLQHQVDERIRSAGRAGIAVDLASIYLLDQKPEMALNALRSTRSTNIPKALAKERRIMEAYALTRLERYDHAIELTKEMEGFDALSALAEAYWHKGDWSEAAATLDRLLAVTDRNNIDNLPLIIMRAAIAARMAGNLEMLAKLRQEYMSLVADTSQAGGFDLITAAIDADGAALAEAIRLLSDLPRTDNFAAYLKKWLENKAEGTKKPPDRS